MFKNDKLLQECTLLLQLYQKACVQPYSLEQLRIIEQAPWIPVFTESATQILQTQNTAPTCSAREKQAQERILKKEFRVLVYKVRNVCMAIENTALFPSWMKQEKGEDLLVFFERFLDTIKTLDFKIRAMLADELPFGLKVYEETLKSCKEVQTILPRERYDELIRLHNALLGNVLYLGLSKLEVKKVLKGELVL